MSLFKISNKFNLLSIFLILLTASGTGGFIIWHHQEDALKDFKQHGKALAQMLAENIEYGVYTENEVILKQVTQGLQKAQNVAYVAVYNKEINILYQHLYQDGLRTPLLSQSNTLGLPRTPHLTPYIDPDNKQNYLDIIVPVYITASNSSVYDVEAEAEAEADIDIVNPETNTNKTDLIGFLQIGLSQQAIYQQSQHFIFEVLSVLATMVLIGILLTLWLTRRITSPIKALVQATESISQGHFSGAINVNSRDEMGLLAKSFNHMAKELQKTQTEVRHQQETLEQQVVDRTQELQIATNQAKDLAQKAEAANKAKSLFLSNMSHELRTPLNAVIGYSELMELDEEDSEQKIHADSIETINKAGKHLLLIIDDILDVSKIEAGKFEISRVEFETAQLLNEVTTLFSHEIKRKGLTLETLYSGEIPMFVSGDFKRIKQVIINLLSNALKFTANGKISFQLSCTQTDELHTLFLFKVIDTGIGIAKDNQSIIFNSFAQADVSNTRDYGGTGLGLSIVKQLVELMGGEIGLISEPDQGSTFWFTVPLKVIDQIQLTTEYKPNNINRFSANILVVEDFQANQMLIARFLEHYGCSVDVVSNGQAAVNQFKTNHYDLVFMDCQMPELDGYEATQLIRQYESNKNNQLHTPIIALTAHALNENHEKCLNAGMDSVITKPFCRQDLYNALEKWLAPECISKKDTDLQVPPSNNVQTITFDDAHNIEAIDLVFLRKNFDLNNQEDQKFIKKLTTIFQQNGNSTMDLLKQAISENNPEEIKGYAHDLKSICANVGAFKLTEQCKMMEQPDVINHTNEAVNLFKQMKHEFSLVTKDLNHINELTD